MPAAADASPSGGVNPCRLLTQAEVDVAAGQPLGAGDHVLPGDCQWTTKDFAAGVDVTVGDWEANKANIFTTGHTPTTIAGLGDEALNLNSSNGSMLFVRKGATGFTVMINGPHVDGLADHGLVQEQTLAKAIYARL